ncbi:MAG: PrsW family glutamic-type intramembrane protease [Bacteroidota bacterium]
MPVLYLLLAILPGLAISWWIYQQDKHEKEPHRVLLICFFLGMATCFPAIVLEEFGVNMGFDVGKGVLITFIFAFVVVAGSEELVKFLALRFYPYARDSFNEPLDGIVYSVMISMGFATLENIFYVFDFGLQTGLLRMFTAVPAHAAFAVVMGYYVGLAKFDKENHVQLMAKGLGGAILIHGAYDFFLFQQMLPALALLAFVSLYLAIYYSRKLIKEHQDNSPFNEDSPNYIPPEEESTPEETTSSETSEDTGLEPFVDYESTTDYDESIDDMLGLEEE